MGGEFGTLLEKCLTCGHLDNEKPWKRECWDNNLLERTLAWRRVI